MFGGSLEYIFPGSKRVVKKLQNDSFTRRKSLLQIRKSKASEESCGKEENRWPLKWD